jgi:intracellular sulfur oxidation DsrE/DsrF family protein
MKLITKLVAIVASVMILASAMTGASAANERYGKQKVVYHINYNGGEDDKAYRGALRNIQNHINAVGKDNMEIKVVLHGNGVGFWRMPKPTSPCRWNCDQPEVAERGLQCLQQHAQGP